LKKQNVLNLNLTTDVESLLDDIGIVVVNAGREISCQCPFHTDTHPSFSINSDTGLWICYQCGRAGNLASLLETVAGVEDPEAAVRHMKRAKFRGPVRGSPEEYIKAAEKVYAEPEDPYYLYAKYMSFGDPPEWAMAERYIWYEACAEYGIRWNKGWVIPIWSPRKPRDVTADFWGWQFKRMDAVSNYPPGIKKSQTLFGMNVLKGRTAVLVESPLDVVRMSMVGIPAVASYGAMVSHYQIGLIEARLDHVTLALDNDKAGQEQTEKIFPLLHRKLPTVLVAYPQDVKDPGDATDEQLKEMFE
jgi:DNA primase